MKANFKYKKIIKYLNSKNASSYNSLDNILKYYIDGKLESLLNNVHFSNINIYVQINKKANYLQINCHYYNFTIDIAFYNNYFDYVAYLSGISAYELDKSINTKEYSNDFDIEKFFVEFFNVLQKDCRLRDDTKIKNRRNKYKIIANLCLFIPWIIIGIIMLDVILNKKTVQLNSWFLFIIIVPLIMWFIFDVKSKK